MHSKEDLKIILNKYLDSSLTGAEQESFEVSLQDEAQADIWKELLEEVLFIDRGYEINSAEWQPMIQDILNTDRNSDRVGKVVEMVPARRRKWYWAAAAILIIVLGIGYKFFNKPAQQEIAKTQEQRFKNDVLPGGYKAKLTLADGSTIVLDSAKQGALTKQGSTAVINKDGQLLYEAGDGNRELMYNTLTTAKGETYATVLADGSKVWLNAASTIKYPVAFNGKERRVEITGEAYFEVKHNAAMPFIVSVNGMEVHDLGTEFNINAYSDEATISTTLVQGSAKVVKADKEQMLIPGQQAQVGSSEIRLIKNADIAAATAWKTGRFYFENSNVESIMRQAGRWYDIDVEFQDKIPDLFVAKIPREVPVSELLKLLELTERVHFKIDGRKVTVMK